MWIASGSDFDIDNENTNDTTHGTNVKTLAPKMHKNFEGFSEIKIMGLEHQVVSIENVILHVLMMK